MSLELLAGIAGDAGHPLDPLGDRPLVLARRKRETHVTEEELPLGSEHSGQPDEGDLLPEIRKMVQGEAGHDEIDGAWARIEGEKASPMELDLGEVLRIRLSLRMVEHRLGDIDREHARSVASGSQREGRGTAAEVHDDRTGGYPQTLDEGQLGLEIRALLCIIGSDLIDAVEVHPDLTELVVVPARKLHRFLRVR